MRRRSPRGGGTLAPDRRRYRDALPLPLLSGGPSLGDLIAITLSPWYDDLDFMSPLSPERARRIVGFLADGLVTSDEPPLVLDVGCGWAELLLRVLEAVPAATGVGVDTKQVSIDHGRDLAARRGLAGRVALHCADARTHALTAADAVICAGASQIWGPPVEAAQPLDYSAALSALRDLVARAGRVLYAESIWTKPPTPAAIAPLAGREDELVALPELLEIAAGHGFAPLQVGQADLDEWDVFESGYTAPHARWLAAHAPDDPDAEEVRQKAADQRSAYFGGYRGVLGFAYLGLVAV